MMKRKTGPTLLLAFAALALSACSVLMGPKRYTQNYVPGNGDRGFSWGYNDYYSGHVVPGSRDRATHVDSNWCRNAANCQ